MLINPEGAEQAQVMFKKSVVMLLSCFKNEQILTDLKHIDAMVTEGRVFESLKSIRSLFPIEDEILNNRQMPVETLEDITREIAPWR